MRWQGVLRTVGFFMTIAIVALSATLVWSQGQNAAPFLAPATQVVAVRAGRLYDPKTGTLLTNQVVLIRGDRIAEVGSAVQIPPEATVLDLSGATVLPGMIDTHVHVSPEGRCRLPDDTIAHDRVGGERSNQFERGLHHRR